MSFWVVSRIPALLCTICQRICSYPHPPLLEWLDYLGIWWFGELRDSKQQVVTVAKALIKTRAAVNSRNLTCKHRLHFVCWWWLKVHSYENKSDITILACQRLWFWKSGIFKNKILLHWIELWVKWAWHENTSTQSSKLSELQSETQGLKWSGRLFLSSLFWTAGKKGHTKSAWDCMCTRGMRMISHNISISTTEAFCAPAISRGEQIQTK